MAVFRIEKNSDFTIMPNYPFRDMRLSFKGRGLLGTMLTLRDDWDYTLAGLTAISPHGKSYVSTGLNELEQLGYLERRQLRDEQGRSSTPSTSSTRCRVPFSRRRKHRNPKIRKRLRRHRKSSRN